MSAGDVGDAPRVVPRADLDSAPPALPFASPLRSRRFFILGRVIIRLVEHTGRRPSLGTASVPREYSEPRLGACSEARCLESAPPRLGRGPLPSLGGCQWSPRRHRASVPRLGGGLGLLLGSWREPVPRETSDDKGFLCFVSKSRDGAISGMYLMLSVHQKIYTSKRK